MATPYRRDHAGTSNAVYQHHDESADSDLEPADSLDGFEYEREILTIYLMDSNRRMASQSSSQTMKVVEVTSDLVKLMKERANVPTH